MNHNEMFEEDGEGAVGGEEVGLVGGKIYFNWNAMIRSGRGDGTSPSPNLGHNSLIWNAGTGTEMHARNGDEVPPTEALPPRVHDALT